jgi:hypothetical protein
MSKGHFLLKAFDRAHASDTNLLFQHEPSFEEQDLLNDRNDCCVTLVAHLWNCMDSKAQGIVSISAVSPARFSSTSTPLPSRLGDRELLSCEAQRCGIICFPSESTDADCIDWVGLTVSCHRDVAQKLRCRYPGVHTDAVVSIGAGDGTPALRPANLGAVALHRLGGHWAQPLQIPFGTCKGSLYRHLLLRSLCGLSLQD